MNTLAQAQAAYQSALLSPVVRTNSAAWNEAYYSSSSLKSFTRRYEAFAKEEPARALHVRPSFDAVVLAWTAYETTRLAEKARKADKRAAVAAKWDLKAELNLQEGVSLKGVDVGQYKVILAGLEPVRAHVEQARHNALREAYHAIRKQLELHVGNALAAFPHPRYKGDVAYPKHFLSWFKQAESAVTRHVFVSRPQAEIGAHISSEATQFALAYVQGYAAKLSVKTGEAIANDSVLSELSVTVSHATVSSTDLWRNSEATIWITTGKREFSLKFHTQIIWNRSCLGKVFNQYPTRRVDTAS